jgi:hypothetical protein
MNAGQAGLVLTGQLGDVMKESAQIALSYVRGHAEELGIDESAFEDREFHVHVPAGAIPKDGPSAGVTMVTALASLLSGRPVKHTVGMTGEVTLQGRVLPIGGLKQKVLAAHAAGLTDVILPERNRGDLDDVPEEVREQMTFHPVMTVQEVLAERGRRLGPDHRGDARLRARAGGLSLERTAAQLGRASSLLAPTSWPPGQDSACTTACRVADPDRPHHAPNRDERRRDRHAQVKAVQRGLLGGGSSRMRLRGAARAHRGDPAAAAWPPRAPRAPRRQPGARQAAVERRAEGGRHGRAERGRAEQPRDARDRVVHARGDTRLLLARPGEHRRRQRRDRHRQPQREHEQRGQHFGDVVDLEADALEQQQPAGRHQRAARP